MKIEGTFGADGQALFDSNGNMLQEVQGGLTSAPVVSMIPAGSD